MTSRSPGRSAPATLVSSAALAVPASLLPLGLAYADGRCWPCSFPPRSLSRKHGPPWPASRRAPSPRLAGLLGALPAISKRRREIGQRPRRTAVCMVDGRITAGDEARCRPPAF